MTTRALRWTVRSCYGSRAPRSCSGCLAPPLIRRDAAAATAPLQLLQARHLKHNGAYGWVSCREEVSFGQGMFFDVELETQQAVRGMVADVGACAAGICCTGEPIAVHTSCVRRPVDSAEHSFCDDR